MLLNIELTMITVVTPYHINNHRPESAPLPQHSPIVKNSDVIQGFHW